MTLKLTRSVVLETLEEIVAENGEDYVYPLANTAASCQYANPDGTPSCIVGHLIYKLDPSVLDDIRTSPGGYNIDGVFSLQDGFIKIKDDPSLLDALENLQNDQDMGKTWGVALDRFKVNL